MRRRPLLADGRGRQLRVVLLLEQHGMRLLARRFSRGHPGQQLLAAAALALPTEPRHGVQPFGDGAEAKSTGNHSDEFASRQP